MKHDDPFYQSSDSDNSDSEADQAKEIKENNQTQSAYPPENKKTVIPLSHEIHFPEGSGHIRGITAMALDRHRAT